MLMSKNGAGGSGPNNPVGGSGDLNSKPSQYVTMQSDLPEIRHLVEPTRKGFGPISDRFIKMDFEHILEGKVIIKTKGNKIIKDLNGCHHDLLGHLEANNIINLEDKIFGMFGTYKARPFGHKYYKSFFPQHWSRKEVILNIYEAYDDFLISGATAKLGKDGKWIVRGFSKIGLEIEMYIDKGGVIRTAYPIL